ncbi:hypothetical protein ACOAOH_24080 [Pseudomonas aeruginosa]|uniref:hypothetical protein n=1 Tax=Pseudomonas aeruginosa TaxID=287 RepID=UPI0029BFAD79|nr:hypothetical protein [Pseudomonas aeruginosa]HCF3246188.1 hypothetical protein [Pseudomonas aeruginosa]HCR1227035.1 hypothetical protein [Pseudomonas aeruginosa]
MREGLLFGIGLVIQEKEIDGVHQEDEDIWDWATMELGTLFYAFEEGDLAAIPPLEDLQSAVDQIALLAGWRGLEPEVLPLRRLLAGPNVSSYAEVVRLAKDFLDRARERIFPLENEQPPHQLDHDVPF